MVTHSLNAQRNSSAEAAPRSVPVWDLPTRLFHWALVALLPLLWWSERNENLGLHKLLGYATAGLLAFRLYWGFAGSATARFSAFLRGPRAIMRYLRGQEVPTGHNPLGALSIVALLATLAVMLLSGLFIADEDGLDFGPFAAFVGYDTQRFAARLHAIAFDVLLALLLLHLAAVLVYQLAGKNLVVPMVTGRQTIAPNNAPRMARARTVVPGVALGLAVFAVLWLLDRGAAW